MAALWFLREPAAAAIRPLRFQFILQQSERAMHAGDTLGAQRLAREAWQLQQNDLVSLKKLMLHARVLSLGDLPEMTILVFHHPEADPETQREILRWLLDRGDTATFTDLHQNMGTQRAARPEIRLLQAESLARQGRILEAVEEARALADVPATSGQASLLLTSLLPRLENNPLAWEQARQRIVGLLQGSDPDLALKAWRNFRLLSANYRDPGPQFDIEGWISRQSGIKAEDRLLARQMELTRLPEAERPAFFDKVISEFAGEPTAFKVLALWLLENNLPARLLQLPEDPMRNDLSLYSARLQALVDVGRLPDAEAWLKNPHPEMGAVLVTSLKAAFASQAGRRSEAASLWEQALDQARSFEKFGDCVSILKVADRFRETEIANRALEAIIKLPAGQLPSSQNLEFLEVRLGDRPELLRRFWEDLLRFRPNDPIAGEQVAFFHVFVAGDAPTGSGSEQTALIVKNYPKVLRFRTTHALWLMRESKDAEAVAALKEAPVNWNQVGDWDRAVYTLALYRTGNVRDAQALEKGLAMERLSPLRREALSRLSKVPGTTFVLANP